MLHNILFAVGFVISLLVFYELARDDVKLVSLKLTDNAIFDMFFTVCLMGILGGRIVYILGHLKSFPLNFLNFILIPYHPGLSLAGSVGSGFLALLLLLKSKHILRIRFFDLAALSILPILVLGFVASLRLLETLVFILLSIFLTKIYKNPVLLSKLNFQGAIFSIFLAVFSVVGFISLVPKALLTVEALLVIITFMFAIYLLSRGLTRGVI